MASTIDHPRLGEIRALLRSGHWREAVDAYEQQLTREERAAPNFRLAYAIALFRVERERAAFQLLDRHVLGLPNARDDLRRFVVADLVREGRAEAAIKVLDRLIAADAGSIADRRSRASLRGGLRRWSEALEDARIVARELPDDLTAQRSLMQILLKADLVEESGALAASLGDRAALDFPLANIALLALTRSGRKSEAARLALKMADSEAIDEVVAAVIVRTLVETGSHDQAIETGERLLDEGWEHEVIRSHLAQAYLLSHREDRYERAIEHLHQGLDIDPDDVRMNMAMGEALLRSRNYEASLPHLRKACELQPKVAHQRALYARALKQVGRFAEAAREFRTLLELQPSSPRWARYAAGALAQAGSRKEGAELFDKFVAERRATLPRNFEQGLKALWDRLDSAKIPAARLDWAWELRGDRTNDREDWERRAKWGHLADHYLLDWLECREDRVQDAMIRLADLEDADRALATIDRSKGMILASAHLGPMYAGPLALELLGVRSRWLASTPTVARTAYAESLISTSEQDDMQVAKAFMLSLRKGYSVIIAVDGAINLAAPRIQFEGQEITYSSFAARTAHRIGVPSVFAQPRWEGDRIGFVIKQLPDPLPDEDVEIFAERWRDAFLSEIRDYLSGAPENLRLSGGLWRQIR
ncbi:MAG: tetratricopeptide repeat protein [Pseudomonadota bacterium]|nr:tetratricopeptide repeat protein [Pseudomonadota bacterium]